MRKKLCLHSLLRNEGEGVREKKKGEDFRNCCYGLVKSFTFIYHVKLFHHRFMFSVRNSFEETVPSLITWWIWRHRQVTVATSSNQVRSPDPHGFPWPRLTRVKVFATRGGNSRFEPVRGRAYGLGRCLGKTVGKIARKERISREGWEPP